MCINFNNNKSTFYPTKISGKNRVGVCTVNTVFMKVTMDSFKNYHLFMVADPSSYLPGKSLGTICLSFFHWSSFKDSEASGKILTFIWCVVFSVILIQRQRNLLSTYCVLTTF